MLQRSNQILKKYKRWIITFVTIVVVLVLAVTLGGIFINRKVQHLIAEKLRFLHEQGILLKFDSLTLNPLSGSIHAKNILIEKIQGKDSLTDSGSFKVRIKYFVADGISLIPLVQKRLRIHSVQIIEPHITFTSNEATLSSKKPAAFEIVVDKLFVSKCFLQITDTLQSQSTFQSFFNIKLNDVRISRENIPINWQVGALHTNAVEIRLPTHFYTFNLKQLSYDASDQLFSLDSLSISPWFEEIIFSQKTGKQTDRISGMIPFLKMRALTYTIQSKPIFNIHQIDLQINLDVYRDRRFPFIKERSTVLPAEFLYQLPVTLTIDTLNVNDSFVAYTEHPEEGDEAGTVFFDKLQATIVHITNDSLLSSKPAMHAEASFMGEGTLEVDFKFPQKPGSTYFVKGTLTGFPMPNANDMLEPAAKIKIESGFMDVLKFHFWYNDYRSDGSLELNYKNVRILSLNDKTKKNPTNRFITFLLNTFIVKKNMDEGVPDEKRTGSIQFVRDTKRSIFNYWWKSILSGIKSAYNMENLKKPKEFQK